MSDWLWALAEVATPFQPVESLSCVLHSAEQKPWGAVILPGHQALEFHHGGQDLALCSGGQLGYGVALVTGCKQLHQPCPATHCCLPSASLVPLLNATTRECGLVLLCARLPRDSAQSASTLLSRESLLDLSLNTTPEMEFPLLWHVPDGLS